MYYLYWFIATLLYALLPSIAKKAAIDGMSPLMFIALTMFILASGALIWSLIFEKTALSWITPQQWVWILVFAIVNLVAFFLFVIAVKQIPVASYQAMSLIMPIVWGIVAYFLFWEKLSTHFFVWFALMSLWLIIALWTFTAK